MLGAIIGDIVGSVYEWHPIKTKDFRFSPITAFSQTIRCVRIPDEIKRQAEGRYFTEAPNMLEVLQDVY